MTQKELYEEELRRATDEIISILSRIDKKEMATVYIEVIQAYDLSHISHIDIPVQELLNALEACRNNDKKHLVLQDGTQLELERIKTITYNQERIYERERFKEIERMQSYTSLNPQKEYIYEQQHERTNENITRYNNKEMER